MKIITLLVCAVLLCSCETTHRHAHHRKTVAKIAENTTIISADKTGALVPQGWLNRYHRMEKSDGTIPEDSAIYAEGDAFRIPPAVEAHFEEMVRSQ